MDYKISGSASAGVDSSSVDDCSDIENDNNDPDREEGGGVHLSPPVSISHASISSLSLFSLSALSLLTLLSEVSGSSTNQTSSATIAIATTGVTASTESTTSTMAATTASRTEDESIVAGAILAVIVIATVIVFLGVTCATFIRQALRMVGVIDIGQQRREVHQLGHIGGAALGNGHAIVGARDPNDRQGEIVELREARWGWGYIPGRIIPVVVMGGAQENEEEEAENAV